MAGTEKRLKFYMNNYRKPVPGEVPLSREGRLDCSKEQAVDSPCSNPGPVPSCGLPPLSFEGILNHLDGMGGAGHGRIFQTTGSPEAIMKPDG